MNREILFRGKTEQGEWVYGFYTLTPTGHNVEPSIITGTERLCSIPQFIDPSTIGQYTGLTDKNGTKIFEGDIVDYFTEEWGGVAEIKYVHGGFIVRNDFCFELISQANGKLEVIGNIHEEVQE